MTVDIYTETTWKSPRRQTGLAAYIIVVRYNGHEDFTEKKLCQMKEATMQEAELFITALALGKAVGMARIAEQKQINIISSNKWVGSMAANLPNWQKNGWKNAKGEDVKHKEWWEVIAKVSGKKDLIWIPEHEQGSGVDGYQKWLRDQLEKR